MSLEEKNAWIYGLIAAVIPVVYLVTIFGQTRNTSASAIQYQQPLLTAIGGAIVLSIVLNILVAVASPKEAGKKDQRDKEINRYGQHVAGIVLAVGMLVPFGLAMTGADHFWTSNTMYLSFVLSALLGTAVKLLAYRRGF